MGEINRVNDWTPGEDGEQMMPYVGGKRFVCECRCNVFTRRGDIYTCNACQAEYQGESRVPGREMMDERIAEEIAQAVLTERERCLAIVRDQTPSHFTRDYRPTDAMRDAICRLIRSGDS